jgi:hypothetical protein
VSRIKNYPGYVQALRDNDYAAVIDYIAKNTNENDQVLLIGAESVVNFLARRGSALCVPVSAGTAGTPPNVREYFNQILENKPTLIIDTADRTTG